VNLLAPQDHNPLGITWGASQLLKLVTALVRPVPLDVMMVSEQILTAPCLVQHRNLGTATYQSSEKKMILHQTSERKPMFAALIFL
jgi:hypothetical protein